MKKNLPRICVLILIVCLLSVLKSHDMLSWTVFIASVFGIAYAALFFGKFLFALISSFYIVLSVIDLHLNRMYGISVLTAAPWLALLIADTNKTEVIEYLPKISRTEWGLIVAATFPFFLKSPLKKKYSPLFLCAFIPLFLIGYVSHLYPVLQFFATEQNAQAVSEHNAFRFHAAASEQSPRTVILIIGESHRYAEFSKAFEKYAPHFQNLFFLNDMISQHANTMRTVPMILSRKKFENTDTFFTEKSIFSLFEEAGYDTYFMHYTATSNITEKNDLSFVYNDARHFVNFANEKGSLHDKNIVGKIRDILRRNTGKKLIVVKMIGVHIDFQNRYPPEFDTHRPSLRQKRRLFAISSKPTAADREKVLNSYKNAMDYSVKIIFDILTEIKKQPVPSLAFFSSDHGICIFEKGHLQLPPDCKQAFHIPAFFYLNPLMNKNAVKLKNLACNTNKPLTQEYLFETIASLADIDYPAKNEKLDLTTHCVDGKIKRTVERLNFDRSLAYEDL